MGIFDFFKKKDKPQEEGPVIQNGSISNGGLEEILKKFVTNPAAGHDMYRQLSEAWLMAVMVDENAPNARKTTEEGVSVMELPDGRIPVFSSTNRVFDKGVIREEVFFMQSKLESLVRTVPNAHFVLDPFSDHAIDLPAETVKKITDG